MVLHEIHQNLEHARLHLDALATPSKLETPRIELIRPEAEHTVLKCDGHHILPSGEPYLTTRTRTPSEHSLPPCVF